MQSSQIRIYKSGDTPGHALSLEKAIEDGMEASYNPFDPVEPDYRHYLLLRALPRVIQNELTPKQRQCLEMRYFQGLESFEIAKRLGVQPPVVSKHLSIAEKKIKHILGYLFAS